MPYTILQPALYNANPGMYTIQAETYKIALALG